MADRKRIMTVKLNLGDGNLSAGAGVAKDTYQVETPCRLIGAQLALRTTGSVSGNTDVDVQKNGTSVMPATTTLRIAQGAANKTIKAAPTVGVVGEPSGVPLVVGDLLTASVEAVPGTVSAGGSVYLTLLLVDV